LVDETLSLYAGLPRVTFVRRYDTSLPPVRVDPEQFKRVVLNLVDNAVEAFASRQGGQTAYASGTITISTRWDVDTAVARLVIEDDGPGLGSADRSRLFLPYYSTKGRDSGLGLAIVRRILQEHNGSIEVSDVQPHGARFTLELPI